VRAIARRSHSLKESSVKRTVVVVLATLFVVGAATTILRAQRGGESSPLRVATISLTRIAGESNEGKAANQRLMAFRDKMASDLAAKQKELQQDQARPADQRQAEFTRLAQQSQTEWQNMQRQLQVDVKGKMDPIVAEIATQHGFDLVLNSDAAVVWSSKKSDITNEVLTKLNAAAPPK